MQSNQLEFEVWGRMALFTDPLTKGGEKMSYPIPTYSSLVGICESIYWKPTFKYVIDKVRIMNQIDYQPMGVINQKGVAVHTVRDLAKYTYLNDARYQVQAHIIWSLNRPDLEHDRDMKKHSAIMNRACASGGRMPILLGVSECAGNVKPCVFGENQGYYDEDELHIIGNTFHSKEYADNNKVKNVYFFTPVMKNGVIKFPSQKQCIAMREV